MTVILIRHGRSTANTSGLLAGRTPGVGLDDRGRSQAEQLTTRLASVLPNLTAVVRSPLQRCAETVDPLLSARPDITAISEPNLEEVDYGDWSNRKISELVTEPLWKTVQQQPSAAVFPGGEGLLDVSRRATAAIRGLDRVHGGENGNDLWVACSHGDVIKAILADALGMHLDQFQRIVVDPASISVIHYGEARPYVHTVNNGGVLELPRTPMKAGATVGGSTGQ
ncbi:MSMEG_4193 family putative phosphomutase [Gordonia phthalatica]|uniref:Phosphoglycerate kinase n=1 Tax=Gordonia phthalatica TaxID=1136941 RepID=A0A0N9NHB7_9ACTN|nr:MSMEG_4193 family putative phosphomutase [Gordonia phthalatica]ALG84834.1 phosphoglycerate kinase [Gordonia phthalatica]